MKIIILDSRKNSYVSTPDLELDCLAEHAQVQLYHVDCVEQLPIEALDCDGIISWHLVPLGKESLERFTQCKAIVRSAVGFDNINLEFARSRDIHVANVPDYGTEEVADHTLALSLALVRKLKGSDRIVRHGSWDWREVGAIPRMSDMQIGIIGMGRIGSAAALRFKAFGCRVGFYDPTRASGWEKAVGVERFETLNELLAFGELISIHAPLNVNTRHMISHDSFSRMQGKFLINTARGAIIDPDALVHAMEQGTLRGLGLDVYENEARLPSRLLMGEEVIWTPHVAFYSDSALSELRTKAAQCVLRILQSGWHRNVVN
jgi:C-terminal binding protein